MKINLIISLLLIIVFSSCSNLDEEKKSNLNILNNQNKKEVVLEQLLGERIDGPANLRDTINGRILFSLNDNVLVETSIEKNNWYVIGVDVKLTEKEEESFKILPNTDLISIKGDIIGKTIDTVDIWMAGEYGGMIGAYTHIGNIKKQTIPEYSLANELKKGNLTKSKLKQFIYNFDFKDYEEYDQLNFTQFYIYESIVEDMSPRDRITLLFDKKENLAGIIHSRKLTTDRFKTYKLIRGHSLTITSDMKESEVEELINKRIKFYNSVD